MSDTAESEARWHSPPPREPKMLCGAPYILDDPEDPEGYCGLHYPHPGPHMMIFWWTDRAHDWPER